MARAVRADWRVWVVSWGLLFVLEKEREVDGLSPNGKASPLGDRRPNGAPGHCSDEEAPPPRLYSKPRDYVEATICHVKDLENGQ